MAEQGYWISFVRAIFLFLTLCELIVDTTAYDNTNGLREGGQNVCKKSKVVTYQTITYTAVTYYRLRDICKVCLTSSSYTRYRLRTLYRQRTQYYLSCCDGRRRSGDSCTIGVPASNGLRKNGKNVCEVRGSRSVQRKIQVPYKSLLTYNTKCGWFGWGRCKRSRPVTYYKHHNFYVSVFDTYLVCCAGWSRVSRRVPTCPTAICRRGCNNGGTCVAPNECKCAKGWAGPSCIQDINECQRNNGGCQDICVNRLGATNVCSCRKGFIIHPSDNKKCIDVNECEINNGNCEHNCRNLIGRHRCQCRVGFVLDNNKRTCSDIDECKLGDDDCEDHCNNTVGGYMCSCRKGYQLTNDNKTCTDVDECAPRNILGSYLTTSLSGCHHICSNFDGSFQCSCRNGYKLMYNRRRCKDIGECATGNHSCEQNCHNTDGSYSCSCKAGFKILSDRMSCEAIPCEKIDPPRQSDMVCSGLVTGANCTFSCKPGYDLVGSQSRTCLPSSRWSGNWTSCRAKHCQKLTTKSERETLSFPCFSSFGSTCYFGCRPGFFLRGDGRANCSLKSRSDKVSWKIGQFSCEEITTCQLNPCRHGGKCLDSEEKNFSCNCEGTGYEGNHCQSGIVSTPVFPKLRPNFASRTLHLMARPSKQVKVFLHSEKGVTFEPLLVDIRFSKTKGDFTVKSENLGIHTVTYSIEGENKNDFQTPKRSVVLVAPEVFSNDRLQQKRLLPTRELPIGCEKYHTKDILSCEVHLLSTAPWFGTPPSTSGIVHLATANNQNIPLSLIGLNMKSLNASRDEIIDAAIAATFGRKEFILSHQINGTCHSRIARSENLLELMDDDAFVSSFMKIFSQMAPKWFKVAVSDTNNDFDIENIAVNVGSDLEHCSGFPLSQRSRLVYYRPAVEYKMFVAKNEVNLLADGRTCFAVDMCKPAVFLSVPKKQAALMKNTLTGPFRDMNVSGIGLFNKKETFRLVKGIIWDGIKLQELLPFDFNMWLKGSLSWTLEVPTLLLVTLKIKGEKIINARNLDNFFTDGLSQPLEMQFKGKAFVSISGRVLKKDFTMELDFTTVSGQAVFGLGGGTIVSRKNVEGIFLTLKRPVSSLLDQSPFTTYIRPKQSEKVRLAILMSLHNARRLNLEGLHEESSLQGISLSFQSNLCMGKLCLTDLSTTLEYVPGRNRFLNATSGPLIRARGKVFQTIPLSDKSILSLQKGQVIEMVFTRDSKHVWANFEANVRLFDIYQRRNVSFDETQLSFEMEGKIFNKYLASMKVVARTNHTLGWNSLVFLVEGRLLNSSLLSLSLKEKINTIAKRLAEKASKRVKDVEGTLLRAQQRVDSTKTLVREKRFLLKKALRAKRIKHSKLQDATVTYAEAKSRLNSSLKQFLELKSKKICSFHNCSYVYTNNCMPAVCQKKVSVHYPVQNCRKETKTMAVDVIDHEIVEVVEKVPSFWLNCHTYCGELGKDLQNIGNTAFNFGTTVYEFGPPLFEKAAIVVTLGGVALSSFGHLADHFHISGCDKYCEKKKGRERKVIRNVTKTELKYKEVNISAFVCDSPKMESRISSYDQPVECCKNDAGGYVLDPKCVSHNSLCVRNMTTLAHEIQFDNQESSLHQELHALVEKEKLVTIAQMELNKARAELDLASNQLKLTLAFLKRHEYAHKSIDITTVRSREKMGIKLHEKLKGLEGNALISVESLVFSVSMTRSSTKMLIPLTSYLRTSDGLEKTIEFSMDFRNENHSLTVASRRIVETLFGISRSRKRRSTEEDPFAPQKNDGDFPLGQHECLFSQEVHSFFLDVVESLQFAVKSRKDIDGAMSAAIRGLAKLSDKEDKDGVFFVDAHASPEIWAAFNDTVNSLRKNQLNISRMFSWNDTLNNLFGFLDVFSREYNFTECSGVQDCFGFFFDSLEAMYETEYRPRAMEIKWSLKELEKIVSKIFKGDHAMPELEEMISEAKLYITNSRDDDILCGKKPIILRSSPVEVVALVGETIKLVCEAVSTLHVEYLWMKNGQPLENTNDTILELTNVTTQSEGAYKCQVSNSRGSTMSNVTIVLVHQRPNITEQPRDALVLVGEQILSLVCSSTGVPRPSTEWFFIPMKGKTSEVFRVNATKPVLELQNLTSENTGFYYCNVSNMHGIVRSRIARVDVVKFAPGVPRIAVGLRLKKWPKGASSGMSLNKSQNNGNSSISPQPVDSVAFDRITKELFEHMNWPMGNIESQHYSPFPNASILFVIKGHEPSIPDKSPSKRIEAALNSFSLSRRSMWNSLKRLYSAIEDENFVVKWNNLSIRVEKESFYVGFPPQMCPKGTSRHENGFLCVNCPPGYYGVANGTCLQCPSGTYQPDEGRRNCLNCRFRRSLTQPGAHLESQCIDISIPCKPPDITTKEIQLPKERKNRYHSGETISFGCKVGYKGIGNATRQCNEGHWTTKNFYCEKTCVPPWTEFKKSCYKVIDVPTRRWKAASAKCQLRLRSRMVTISSEEENEFAVQLAKAYLKNLKTSSVTKVQMWLGLRKKHPKAQFQWVDGVFLEGSYTNWAPGEPNNVLGREMCTEMLVSGNVELKTWSDVTCNAVRYKSITICEKPLR